MKDGEGEREAVCQRREEGYVWGRRDKGDVKGRQ